MGGINQFQAPPSPLDRIAQALQIAHSVYGVSQAKQAADLLSQQNDPSSDYSQARQGALKTSLGALVKKGTIDQKDAGPLLASIDKQSGASIDKLSETNPLFQMAKTDGLLALAQARMSTGQEKNELSANKDYAKELKPYEGTIQAANRVDELINQVKSGDLKSTKTFRNDLNSAIGQMFNNGKSATVYGMSHADQASLFGNIQAGKDKILGTASDTIPMAQLDQLQKDVHALRGEYMDAHQQTFDAFKEGVPERLRPNLENRFNKFRQSVATKISKTQSGGGLPGVGSAEASDQTPQSSGPHGATVYQNGTMYQWNPKSGAYE